MKVAIFKNKNTSSHVYIEGVGLTGTIKTALYSVGREDPLDFPNGRLNDKSFKSVQEFYAEFDYVGHAVVKSMKKNGHLE
jgi:hypothetical protein